MASCDEYGYLDGADDRDAEALAEKLELAEEEIASCHDLLTACKLALEWTQPKDGAANQALGRLQAAYVNGCAALIRKIEVRLLPLVGKSKRTGGGR